jgi:hypothetical protein
MALTRHLSPWSVNEPGERRLDSGSGLGMASYLQHSQCAGPPQVRIVGPKVSICDPKGGSSNYSASLLGRLPKGCLPCFVAVEKQHFNKRQMQRRLGAEQAERLVAEYEAGGSMRQLQSAGTSARPRWPRSRSPAAPRRRR